MRKIRIAAAFLGLVFIVEGFAKFLPLEGPLFASWGYPQWFRYAVGVVELAVGTLLFMPQTIWYAAMLAVIILSGAAATLIAYDHYYYALIPISLLVCGAALVFATRRSLTKS